MEAFRQRKKHTKLASAKAEGLITAKIAKSADEQFAAEAGLKIPGHGLSGTVVASAGISLADVPPRCPVDPTFGHKLAHPFQLFNPLMEDATTSGCSLHQASETS